MLDIADNFGYKLSLAYQVKDEVIKAILLIPTVGPLVFCPDDVNWLCEKAELFQQTQTLNPLAQKCVRAVDDIAIKIDKPSPEYGAKDYLNQKGFFTVVCQGVCVLLIHDI